MPLLSFDRLGYRRHATRFRAADLDVDLRGRRCLVTGANSGIGYATAEALAARGGEVVLLCRNASRGRAAAERIKQATGNEAVTLTLVDLSDFESIDVAVDAIGSRPVHVLVHNAGVLPEERIVSPDGYELTLAVHVLGPHRLTRALRSNLERSDGGRVVWVSSGGMLTKRLSLADPNWRDRPYDGVDAYAETKRAQVVLSELWAEQLRDAGVVVNAMHPGWADTPAVRTSLPGFHRLTRAILRTPEEGADTVIWLAASEPGGAHTGRFFFDREPVKTHWVPTTREQPADRGALWALCEGATKAARGRAA